MAQCHTTTGNGALITVDERQEPDPRTLLFTEIRQPLQEKFSSQRQQLIWTQISQAANSKYFNHHVLEHGSNAVIYHGQKLEQIATAF